MKHISLWLARLLCCLALLNSSAAQSGSPASQNGEATKDNKAPASELESKTAAQLFDEADNYARKKFADFEKLKMPFDEQLAERIHREQRDLASRYAVALAARKLNAEDIYFVGLLHNLARDFDAALETMRSFLKQNPKAAGERAQNARAIVIIQAAKKGLLSEAESRLAEYTNDQPQVPADRYALENWVAAGYFNSKDYQRALPHAQQMWNAAKLAGKEKPPLARDATLSEAAVMLSEINLKLKKKAEALAIVHELRGLALALPSGNLHKLALRRQLQIDFDDVFDVVDYATPQASAPPEITADEWIDRQPVKLAELRGRVVLLDFWATWCGPCRETLPRFQKWHESYKDKGLVVLGLTNFEGHAEGKPLTRPQELEYLRNFKKRNGLTYGFAVSDEEDNDRNYTVSSIPTTFLLDRRGVVRFISIGSSEIEAAALNKMIKKLLDEPSPSSPATGQ
ncbi:MAG: redoxin domain-containing protein [Pyrinomonadaceae bacterium]